jgi:transcriptional regulator with XRE-family HTH domain
LAAAHARSNADFSVSSMVAEYDTSELRLAQQPSCNEDGASYAGRMSKPTVLAEQKAHKDAFAVAFGNRLRSVREAKEPKLTQEALGSQVGAKKANVSQWENGSHMPDLKSLAALCDVLGCSADRLLGRSLDAYSPAALEEAKAYDALPSEQQKKWRTMRRALFSPA